MSDMNALLSALENTRTKAVARAHEAYASACETGMNDMIQAVRQAANPTTAPRPVVMVSEEQARD